jgi:undecaprenyl-diphosphatase
LYELGATITHAINALAGHNTALDHLMIWISTIGVPIPVLAVDNDEASEPI